MDLAPYSEKETPTQVFSCEYCEMFNNSFFYKTLPVFASSLRLRVAKYIKFYNGGRITDRYYIKVLTFALQNSVMKLTKQLTQNTNSISIYFSILTLNPPQSKH